MPFDFDLLYLLGCRPGPWYGTVSGCDGHTVCCGIGFLTLTLVGCDDQCVLYPYSVVTSLGLGGVPVVGCRQVLLFNSGECLTCLWLYGFNCFDL